MRPAGRSIKRRLERKQEAEEKRIAGRRAHAARIHQEKIDAIARLMQEGLEEQERLWRAEQAKAMEEQPLTKLTRNERLQLAADAGIDTIEDYRGEK